MKLNESMAAILQMVSMVLIDAIIYIAILAITKEKLVYSFIKKNPVVVEEQ